MTLLRQWRISIRRKKLHYWYSIKVSIRFSRLAKENNLPQTLVTTKITKYQQKGMSRGVLCEIFH